MTQLIDNIKYFADCEYFDGCESTALILKEWAKATNHPVYEHAETLYGDIVGWCRGDCRTLSDHVYDPLEDYREAIHSFIKTD